MTKLKLIFFASLKDCFKDELEIEIAEPTLAEVRKTLVSKDPKIQAVLLSCRFAVNDTFVNSNHVFSENDLILVLPPSSGG